MSDIYWLNEDSRKFLERGYLLPGENPEQRIEDIAYKAQEYLGIDGWADKFIDYMHKGFYSLSSPIWSNFGRERGLPISCFGSYIPDDMEQILGKVAEVGTMSKVGGGTSAYFGDVRPRGAAISTGGTSTGVHHQLTVFDALTNYISQSNVRRGSFAAYVPIDHGDIEEFLGIRGEGNAIQDLSIGVTVSDEWMESMLAGDKKKRNIWGKVIKKRYESGYPYIFFSDNANNNAPQVYKDKGKRIHASNLCTEIFLSSEEDESFVCDLSSLNLAKWKEIVETDAIETLTYFLDAVMTEFINKTRGVKNMESPHKFALTQRALGVGVLGWHSYLQQESIAFESMEAKLENSLIFKTIQERTIAASKEMAIEYGVPSLMEGYGLRNSCLVAIAPTTSSSFILGQISPSIEPLNSNYFTKDLAKGKFTYKNPELTKVLEQYDKDDIPTWRSILQKGGSVQHLKFLTDHEKEVFKTFGEISQKEILIQAAQRQPYIDQGQSINIQVPPKTKPKEVNELIVWAWENGIKSLYYQRSANPAQELARSLNECTSCEG
jgi:ribonucleoside-diphosphate reductase alpha chain|tara:strand:- start:2701 stop:4347 length:1647 start_codon:yes stop_codon:yes gene_type:complete